MHQPELAYSTWVMRISSICCCNISMHRAPCCCLLMLLLLIPWKLARVCCLPQPGGGGGGAASAAAASASIEDPAAANGAAVLDALIRRTNLRAVFLNLWVLGQRHILLQHWHLLGHLLLPSDVAACDMLERCATTVWGAA